VHGKSSGWDDVGLTLIFVCFAIVKPFSFSLRQYILCWAHACKLRWERDRHGEKLEFFSFSFCNAMHDRLGCCVLRGRMMKLGGEWKSSIIVLVLL